MPAQYIRNNGGEHAEFLIRLLLLLARCGSEGVKQENIEELYLDEKGNRPVEKTIRRAIQKLNAIMDPSTSEKDPMFRRPKNARPIQMQTTEESGRRIRRYYLKRMIQLPDEGSAGKPDSKLVFNARRIFRLDHMDRLIVRENLLFTLPADFSLSQYYGISWGIWTESGKSPEPETVVLDVSAAVASHFDATLYHESQTVTILDDGSRRVQFQVAGAVEMIPWILGWGATVRVLEPAWLRQMVRERAVEILAQYDNDK